VPALSATAPHAKHLFSSQAAFAAAIERFEYTGQYAGVFPVKANHDKSLIDAVLEYGALRCAVLGVAAASLDAAAARGSCSAAWTRLPPRAPPLLRVPPLDSLLHAVTWSCCRVWSSAVPSCHPALLTPPCPASALRCPVPAATGAPHDFGLEVGSKAELVMVMARLAGTGRRGVNLVCNGFKDAEYMELVGAGWLAAFC